MKRLIELVKNYKALSKGLTDFEKFSYIAIVYHSTVIEGSTLNALETEILLDKGLIPKGKPLAHSLMAKDHLEALHYILDVAASKTVLTADELKKIAGMVVKNSKGEVHTALGNFDPSKGDLRLLNVSAGSSSFPNFDKVPRLYQTLVDEIAANINQLEDFKAIIDFAFDAHFQLVSIHPWADGNGRTARLLMNYIQHYHDLPLAIVDNSDKGDYIQALIKSRESKSTLPFREFMYTQYEKHLVSEIKKLTKKISQRQSDLGLTLIF